MIPDRLEPVLAELRPLADRFAAAGHRLYLVGGTVRDLLLGRDDHRRLSTSPPTPGPTRSSVCSTGWADARVDPGRALRHDRRSQGRPVIRDHHPPRRGLPPGLAQARRRVRRRDRGRPVAARLHRQRDGARPARPAARRPVRRCADLAAGGCARPLSPEESFSDDPLRMLRAARFIAGYGLDAR